MLDFCIGETEKRICDIHGEYESSHFKYKAIDHWSCCPECAAIEGKRKAAEEKRQQLDEWRKQAIANSGIGDRCLGKTLDDYVADTDAKREVLEYCREYSSRFVDFLGRGSGIVLLGSVGTGKTHLAAGIIQSVIMGGHSAKYTSVSRMIRRIRATYAKGSEESEQNAIQFFIRPDLLVIDEIGVQRGSEYESDMLFDIVNERYEALKPMILIANLTIQEMRQAVGDRVYDRMRENGGRAFVMDWKSHRGNKS